MELEGGDSILTVDLLFSIMTLSKSFHLDRALSGLCSGDRIVAFLFNDSHLIHLNNYGSIEKIHRRFP